MSVTLVDANGCHLLDMCFAGLSQGNTGAMPQLEGGSTAHVSSSSCLIILSITFCGVSQTEDGVRKLWPEQG